ncbi:MAG: hypothetical protein ACYSW8_18705 [Planctomycetota bacterium]
MEVKLRRRSPEEVAHYFVTKIASYEIAIKKALELLEYYENRVDWENEHEAYRVLKEAVEK